MSENFDLLGDPIPEGWGKRGRPQHIATRENRNKVVLLLALGWSNERIAAAIGITPPTLRKNYFRELKVRAEARDRMEAAVAARLWKLVEAGNVGAIKAFRAFVDRNDLIMGAEVFAGTNTPRRAPAARPERLGKKEEALAAAATAGEGTPWAGDLLPPSVN